jgi:SAM-dependent methyltransferase
MTDQQFRAIFESVRQDFPFLDYVDELLYREMSQVVPEVLRYCGPAHGKRLLDIGSGPLDKTALYSALGFESHALDDLSDPWHRLDGYRDAIRDFAKRRGIRLLESNIDEASPACAEGFDVVTLHAVVEHLHVSPMFILNLAGKQLKAGGYLVVTMPNAVNLRKRVDVMRGQTNYSPLEELYFSPDPFGEYRGHVREYTLEETVRLVEWHGFEVVRQAHFEYIAFVKLKNPWRAFFLLLARAFPAFRSGLLVICRKPANWTERWPTSAEYFHKYPHPVLRG